MTLSELTALLFHEINYNLPGPEAHKLMAPYKRPTANSIKQSPNNAKLSAVLMLIYPKGNIPHFTLIQRTAYNGTHGGQISFPGGKQEGNESLKETALRETFEEIGVAPDKIQVLGEITQIYIPPSNFLVSPFIGFVDYEPVFTREVKEVEEIIEVKISDLTDDSNIKQKKIKVGKQAEKQVLIDVPYFELNYEIVWGATATILSEVRQMLINTIKPA
ncbi:MAG: CoA pyrophosphatase [Flavobacteriales bacterium]|nr:CoA pyrophosphatase [Flavobacteriales bacterium]